MQHTKINHILATRLDFYKVCITSIPVVQYYSCNRALQISDSTPNTSVVLVFVACFNFILVLRVYRGACIDLFLSCTWIRPERASPSLCSFFTKLLLAFMFGHLSGHYKALCSACLSTKNLKTFRCRIRPFESNMVW